MRIEVQSQSTDVQTKPARTWSFWKVLRKVCIGFLSILGTIVLIIGLTRYDKTLKKAAEAMDQVEAVGQHIYYVSRGIFSDAPTLNISLKNKDFYQLAYQRKQVLETNIKYTEREYVNAKIEYDGETIPVKLRLKGDRTIHVEDENEWSFKVDVKGKHTLMGMKRFSIQKPFTRNYIYEWIYHKALAYEDVLSLRYDFVNVKLNGKDLGIYALEESFDKHLLEYHQRKNGPIIRFKQENWHSTLLSISPVLPYQDKWWSAPENAPILQQATNALESYRLGKSKFSDVFDVEKMARFFAISDLLAMHHATTLKQIRLYYNPITSKLEPIGMDAHYDTSRVPVLSAELGVSNDRGTWFFSLSGDWYRTVFYKPEFFDPIFFAEYTKTLERFSEGDYLDRFLASIEDEFENKMKIMYKDIFLWKDHIFHKGPDIFHFSTEIFYERQKYIHERLNIDSSIRAYTYQHTGSKLTLEISNIDLLPVELLFLSWDDGKHIIRPKTRTFIPPAIEGQHNVNAPSFKRVEVDIPKDVALSQDDVRDLKLHYNIVGASLIKQEPINSWSYFETDFRQTNLFTQPANPDTFSFITVDQKTKEIRIKPGQWVIDKTLIIPAGYTVKASAGTTIDLKNRALILSYSPLEFIGSQTSPIRIYSSNRSGLGILVMKTHKLSTLRYVTFNKLTNPEYDKWSVTSAVTFYEADADISYCEFSENRSEDALNIVRSNYTISHSTFKETYSDAFDSDFSKGTLSSTEFFDIGNDGIDISGGHATIRNVKIERAGDKAISIGEASHSEAYSVTIKATKIGAAAKDKSVLTLNNTTIEGNDIGLAVYQKKPEYGPGTITSHGIHITHTLTPYLVEENSSLTVDGKAIPAEFVNVKPTLYGK